jgi:hypothetical protein
MISDLEGENVDTAVGLINAAYLIFISSSTAPQSRVPPEWSKTLIRVFQTTTVPEFNQIFKDEEKDAQQDADKNGGQPKWPTHEQLSNARNARERIQLKEAASLQQAAEWGMRAIQGSMPRLKDQLKYEENGEKRGFLKWFHSYIMLGLLSWPQSNCQYVRSSLKQRCRLLRW